MLRRYYTKVVHFFRKWNVYFGCDPRRVPLASIIFCPLHSHILCCGLAGILTIRNGERTPDVDVGKHLIHGYDRIREKGMKAILDGTLPLEEYLGGAESLEAMEKALLLLKGKRPFAYLFFHAERFDQLTDLCKEMKEFISTEEKWREENAATFSTTAMEIINSRFTIFQDVLWGLENDILKNVMRIAHLAGRDRREDISPASLEKYRKINFLLNDLDRLEIRGRDSAGLQIAIVLRDISKVSHLHDLLKEKGLDKEFSQRSQPGDLVNGSIGLSRGRSITGNRLEREMILYFTYKTSSAIGELGQNVRALRETIAKDRILRELAGQEVLCETTMAHTRWASLGSITEKNCHPINNFTLDLKGIGANHDAKNYPSYGEGAGSIHVLLNGDIDNYRILREELEAGQDLIAPELTTDTKIIPLQIEKYLLGGHDLAEAFRLAVNDFEGSHAIAMISDREPGKAFLALRGDGQSIYVGLSPDQYIFSSELYGLVEGTHLFLKMDGEKRSLSGDADGSGQIFILDQDSSGGLTGIRAMYYNGTPISLTRENIHKAEITTRDIDRGDFPHYFLKEISESNLSVRKTLRGKYRISGEEGNRRVIFNLGTDVLPERLKQALLRKDIRRMEIIGHGTAAVAGTAVADALKRYLKGADIRVEAQIASELSGFLLEDDLRDTLIIPITQSGTTTDTNRAVAMAVERGAAAIAIVNRRQSDITNKADGVFYTSDGRDIEMSVASTKAFYSQIIAGHVLALCFAQILKTVTDDLIADELFNLEQAPDKMSMVLEKRDQIRVSAESLVKNKKYWAIVGSGPNKVAADEIRIKLSELCYQTISSDIVENKKHIDLSAEPLILVCATGNPEGVIGDIVKDTAIFKAHKADVVVFADEGEDRFDRIADTVIGIPRAPMPLPVILNTLAGHLWGYYAARSIDKEALFFREFRSRLNLEVIEHSRKEYSIYESIADRNFRRTIGDFIAHFHQFRNRGDFSFLHVKTITDLILLLKYVGGKLPLEDFWVEFKGEAGGFTSPIDLLDIALGRAVDELSRPIDAIRHQAKTVTVGTSRKEQPLRGSIFDLLKELKFSTKNLISKNILTLTRIQPAIAVIKGYTLYDIGNLDIEGNPTDASTIAIRKKGGIVLKMKSRTERSAVLMGTKKTIVSTGHVYVGYGKSDGASLLIIPLRGETSQVCNLLLIHVDFNETLSLIEKKQVLGHRFQDIRNLVNEYNIPWDDRYLETVSLISLLGEPPEVIADRIKEDVEAHGSIKKS